MKRTSVFIDGFNLYHGLCATRRNELKWLSLNQLAHRLVPPRTHQITDVYYFSAIAEHLPDRAIRHQTYLAALRAEGVIPIMGEFKDKKRSTKGWFGCWRVHIFKEEKQTDVNIAIQVVSLAYEGSYETAVLVTADSDLTPLVGFLKSKFPKKELILATPPYRGSDTLRKACDQKRKIKVSMVETCLMPEIVIGAGGEEIRRPAEYDPS